MSIQNQKIHSSIINDEDYGLYLVSKSESKEEKIIQPLSQWPSRWFLLFTYDKSQNKLSQSTLYEEYHSYSIARRCKFLPEMLGLVRIIEEVQSKILSNKKEIEFYVSKIESEKPALLFNFQGNLVKTLPFEVKKIRLH